MRLQVEVMMLVVVVFFEAKQAHISDLGMALVAHARASLEMEPGCRQFDVAQDPLDPAGYFLYEVYDDEAAFKLHCDSERFKQVEARCTPWIAHKKVLTYTLLQGRLVPDAGRA
jgi:(4S)-4-hydroxy-5-phosphonooxypentane-2,3-dione isomerase